MAKQVTEITSPTIARGTDRQTHETFYVVKSDSSDTTWYTVRWNNERSMWCCNCPATQPCKHCRAVNQVLRLRRATIAATMGPGAVVAVARLQAEEDRKLERMMAAPLNRREFVATGTGVPMR